jgi:hypothetical protein
MNRIYLVVLLLGLQVSLTGQNVQILRTQAVGEQIEINYAITNVGLYQSITAELFVSFDGGESFIGPLKEVVGDLGPGLKNGRHLLKWDALREIPFTNEELVFEIRLDVQDIPDRKAFMVSITGNQLTPIGLRIGQLGRVGWYLEGRCGMHPFLEPSFTYSNSEIIDFNQPGYLVLNQNNHFAAWSVIGGLTLQPAWNLFVYAGAGYGRQDYLLGVNEHAYDGDRLIRQSYALYKEESQHGIEMDTGLIYRIGKVVLSAGAFSINFRTIFWNVGIGVAL